MQLSRWTFLAVALGGPLACSDSSFEPFPPQSAYILQAVGGKPLPTTIYEAPGDTTTVLASTINLNASGVADVFERIRYVHPGTPPETFESRYQYGYHVDGNNVVFTFNCPPDAICVAPPTGKLFGLTLTLTFGDPPWRPQFTYFSPRPD